MLNHLPREVVRTMDRGSLDVRATSELHTAAVDSMVKRAFEECDLDRDGKLSFQSFSRWLEKTPEILQFLSSVFPYGNEEIGEEDAGEEKGSTPGKSGAAQRRRSLDGNRPQQQQQHEEKKDNTVKSHSVVSPTSTKTEKPPSPPQGDGTLSYQASAPSKLGGESKATQQPHLSSSSSSSSAPAGGSTVHPQQGMRHSSRSCGQPTMLSMANPFAFRSSQANTSRAWATRSFVHGNTSAGDVMGSTSARESTPNDRDVFVSNVMLLPVVSLKSTNECDLDERMCLICQRCNNSINFDQHTGAPLAARINKPIAQHSNVGWSIRCRYHSESIWVHKLLGKSSSCVATTCTTCTSDSVISKSGCGDTTSPRDLTSTTDSGANVAKTTVTSSETQPSSECLKTGTTRAPKKSPGRVRGHSFSKENPPIEPHISLIQEQNEEDTDSRGSHAASPTVATQDCSEAPPWPIGDNTGENNLSKKMHATLTVHDLEYGDDSDNQSDSTVSSGTRDISVIPDDGDTSSIGGDNRRQQRFGFFQSQEYENDQQREDIDRLAREREISVTDDGEDTTGLYSDCQNAYGQMARDFREAFTAANMSGSFGNDALFSTSSVVFQSDGTVLTEGLFSLCSNCGAAHSLMQWINSKQWMESSNRLFTEALLDNIEQLNLDTQSLVDLTKYPRAHSNPDVHREEFKDEHWEWADNVGRLAANIVAEATKMWYLRHGDPSYLREAPERLTGVHTGNETSEFPHAAAIPVSSVSTANSHIYGFPCETAALHGPFQVPHMDHPGASNSWYTGGLTESNVSGVHNFSGYSPAGRNQDSAGAEVSPILAATLVATGHVSAQDAIKRSNRAVDVSTSSPLQYQQDASLSNNEEGGSMTNFGGSFDSFGTGENSPPYQNAEGTPGGTHQLVHTPSHMRLGAGAARSLTLHGCDMLEKSGPLYKVGARFKQLTKRWYYLEQNFLYWYTRQKDSTPRGVLFLEDSYVKPVDDGQKGYFGISIHTSSAHGERTKVLYAKTSEERDEWLSALRQACRAVPFDEDYEEQGEIGRGRFSQVISAKRKGDGKLFAVKKINKVDLQEDEKELLRTEIAILKLVNHPHIIRLENVYETSSWLYIVMEYLEGGELFDRIVGRSRFKENEARELVKPLVDAMAYLHSLGIAHRDLKPENILTGETLHDLKIADFGLSKIIHPTEKMNKPCGTLSYVAPEVLTGKGYGKQADMWSIGVILFLVVRGKLPFDGRDKEEIAAKTVRETLDFKHQVWKDWTQDGLDFVRGLLERDPEKRLSAREALRHPWLRSETQPCVHYDFSSDEESSPRNTTAATTSPRTSTTVATSANATTAVNNINNSKNIPLASLPPQTMASPHGFDPSHDSVAHRMKRAYDSDAEKKPT